MTKRIRVLLVEDSSTVRARLREVFASDPGVEVVGEATDGKQAIELCMSLRPDVVTMDMILPLMSGQAATEYIMAYCPTPIVIVSSSTNRGELFKTYEALAAGAVDVLDKSPAEEGESAWDQRLLSTVKMASRIPVITHPRGKLNQLSQPGRRTPPEPVAAIAGQRDFEVVAIGASTGGPSAIVRVLRALPESFPLPIIFVLHISAPFASAFAEWLDGQTGRRVVYGRDGERVGDRPGQVIMAPPDRHLIVSGGRVRLTSDPERHSCRPSVDVMCESIAGEYGDRAIGCLLTGMGRDGAAGLKAIRDRGGFTIAQDEATSVIYGMPREAVLQGGVESVLPIGEIGPALAALTVNGRKQGP